MPQSLSQIYVHIIFSTKYRRNKIDDNIEVPLFKYIAGICRKLECYSIIVGGYRNHIHILCQLSRKIAAMKLLEEIKKSSSKWIKTQGPGYSDFYWQNGYGIFSVNYKGIETVKRYIENQKEHHTKKRYEDEYKDILIEANINYDEKYLWD